MTATRFHARSGTFEAHADTALRRLHAFHLERDSRRFRRAPRSAPADGQELGGSSPPPIPLPAGGGAANRSLSRRHRIADILIASSALVAAAPAMAVAAVGIKLEDGGPVLFRQERVGRDGRPFTLLKLRTMAPDASGELHADYIAQLATELVPAGPGGELRKLTHDPRVTRVGRRLRALSLDEVPQFVNVLAGHMSVVGPRPALPYEIAYYQPHHFARFAVLPGLTGLWQVSGRSRLGFLEMLELDVEYVRRQTALLDLFILLLTPRALLGNAA